MSDEKEKRVSAQVVLKLTCSPQEIVEEFARAGFEVGPLIAHNFSIAATGEAFEKYFGVLLQSLPGRGIQVLAPQGPASLSLPLATLPVGIRECIEAVLFSTPPDFGLFIDS